MEEAQFGPGPPINSVFVRGKSVADQNLQGLLISLSLSHLVCIETYLFYINILLNR